MALARVTLAGVAQLVEQLIRNQQVTSSSLVAGSKFPLRIVLPHRVGTCSRHARLTSPSGPIVPVRIERGAGAKPRPEGLNLRALDH
jgi:hypothetical protein